MEKLINEKAKYLKAKKEVIKILESVIEEMRKNKFRIFRLDLDYPTPQISCRINDDPMLDPNVENIRLYLVRGVPAWKLKNKKGTVRRSSQKGKK